jgi:histidinol-phosphatase (PHP family)
MPDYHLHTPYCRHAEGAMEQYARRAVSAGLEEICFTPHMPPVPGFGRGPDWLRMDSEDMPRYLRDLDAVRARHPELTILCGIEADFYDGSEEKIGEFLARYPFDLVLMSVHFLRDWPGESWVFDIPGQDRSLPEVYHEYFAALKRGIRTGLYDAVAHLDLIRQPGHPVLASNAGDVEEVLTLASGAGMSLEINTGGMRRQLAQPYPAPEILQLASRMGTRVILGSDAHEPHLVGYGFAEVQGWLRGCPGLQAVRYRGRKAEPLAVAGEVASPLRRD